MMRKTLLATLLVLAFCAALLTAVLMFLQSARFSETLTERASESLGRSVTLDAPIEIEWGMPPRLVLTGLQIANTDWAEKPFFARIEHIGVAPALWPLLRGRIALDILTADNGQIWLETHPEYGRNWPREKSRGSDAPSQRFFRLSTIDNAEIRNFSIEPARGGQGGLQVDSLSSLGADDRELRLRGKAGGRPIDIRWTSTTSPHVFERSDQYQIEFAATINEHEFSGEFDVQTTRSPPRVTGQWRSPLLALSTSDDSDSGDDRLIPATPLSTEWLDVVESDVTWQIDRLTLNGLSFEGVNGRTRLIDGRLLIDPLDARLGAADLHTRLALESVDGLASLRVSGELEDLNLSQELDWLKGSKASPGHLDLRFLLQGVGNDLRSIASTSDGRLHLIMSEGRISNAWLQLLTTDLGRLMGPFSEAEGSTPVRCMALRLVAEDGQAALEQMVLDTRTVLIVGEGGLDLARETVDVLLIPDYRDASVTRLQLPIHITGPLASAEAELAPTAVLSRAGITMLQTLAGKQSPFEGTLRGRFENSETGCAASLAAYRDEDE
ncbi:MAG: hypothetical protein CMN28_03975 [Salinisphaeraceae bacterium]|nr:hypothetical protein [Salinisphaeraceae bacterium]